MHLSNFDYELPPNLIAQNPVSPRDACKLMVLNRKNQTIEHAHFYQLLHFLKPGDVLVLNNSKVIPARLQANIGNKTVEIFLVRAISANDWIVMGKPGKLLQLKTKLHFSENLQAEIKTIYPDGQRLIRFSEKGIVLENILKNLGSTPLPPYIKHSTSNNDDYQTVYAALEGSVAAPTAGLHFTKQLLSKLQAKGIQLEFVTLHVGPGTFLPIKTTSIQNHQMHSESFFLEAHVANRLDKAKKEGRRIIGVGTTSARVLESCYNSAQGFTSGEGETNLYVYPGYKWKALDGLITNFHLPKSTLLLLTCAFGGQELVLKAYQEAIRKKYRFYSFGDAMLIL